MEQIMGVVKAVKDREKNYGLFVDINGAGNADWFSALGKRTVNKGDKISFNFEKKGEFQNIVGQPTSLDTLKREAKAGQELFGIRWGNCLNAVSSMSVSPENLMDNAERVYNLNVERGRYPNTAKIDQQPSGVVTQETLQ